MQIFIWLFFAIFNISLTQTANATVKADTAFFNGYIYTVDSNHSVADSLAIKDKKIIHVGSRANLQKFIGSQTKQIDLDGKLVLPGFIDSHMHPFAVAWYRYNLNISDPYTVESTLKEIREYSAKYPERKVIEGVGYLRITFQSEQGQAPTKFILDEIDSTRPILILDKNGHSAWANSKALDLMGYNNNTPDPQNGTIERLPNTPGFGEPSGQLLEEAMFHAISSFPVPTKKEMEESISLIQPTLGAYGITTAHEMLADVTKERQVAMFSGADQMARDGKMTFRLMSSWFINPVKGNPAAQIRDYANLAKRYRHPHFQTIGMKFLVDGIIEEDTGLLLDPYCDSIVDKKSDCKGTSVGFDSWGISNQDLTAAFRLVNSLGFQINAHTIGDGAVRKTLNSLEAAKITPDQRPSLEHIQLSNAADIARMGQLGISANVTPVWMALEDYFTMKYFPRLGFERATTDMYPYQSLFDVGVNVTAASDWYVSEPDMPFQIFTAMTRMFPQRIYDSFYGETSNHPYFRDLNKVFTPADFDPEGRSFFPIGSLPTSRERAKSFAKVIESVTINGAKANNLEKQVGSLEVGKLADLVVMDTNFFPAAEAFQKSGKADDLEPVANAKVLKTYFEGKLVYDSATQAIREFKPLSKHKGICRH